MSFGASKRDDLYKQANPLGSYVAKDYSEFSDSTAADGTISKIDSRWKRPASAHFGYSSRADHERHANFLGSPQAQDHSEFQDTTDADKVISKMDSRYTTAPSATFGVSARSDHLKRANDLGTYQPKDYSDVDDTVDVAALTKAIDKRYRTPASPPIATARRDDYVTQANPLGVYMPQDLSGFSDTTDFEKVISPIDSRYKRRPAARFSTSSRDDLKLQVNPLGVYMSKDYSHMPDNTDPSKLISPMDSRWKNQPRVPFSTSKREDILKQANVLGVAQPSSITDSVKYPDKTISDFDSRFKTQPRVPIATAPRDAIYKQANPLGAYVAKDYSEFSDSTAADATISKIDSRWKRPPSVHFGHSKRADIELRANDLGVYQARDHSNYDPAPLKLVTDMDSRWKTQPRVHFGHSKRDDILLRANDLGSYLPKDYSHQGADSVDINKLVSPMDARYRTSPSFSMGASKRGDIEKLSNPLGVPMPQTDNADRPIYCAPSSFEKAAAAARRGGCGHTMGASSRGDALKLYNPQNVPLPKDLSHQDDRTDFTKLVSPMDSRYKRPRSCTFGVGEREDVILLANPLGAKHPPHSLRAKELKERQDAFFGRKVPKGKKRLTRVASAPVSGRTKASVLGSRGRSTSDNDMSDDDEGDAGKTRRGGNGSGNLKARLSPKQKMIEEVRRENARFRKQNNESKVNVLRKARANSSSWVKHFQRTVQKPT